MTDKDVSKKISYIELIEAEEENNKDDNTPRRRRVSNGNAKSTGRRAG